MAFLGKRSLSGASCSTIAKKPKTASTTFALPPSTRNCPRLIIAGLDPPANSEQNQQHNNHTSKMMIKVLGNDHFDWIDFSKLAAVGVSLNGAFDRKQHYKTLLASEEEVNRFERELVARVHEEIDVGNTFPIVYAAGEIVNTAFYMFKTITRESVICATLRIYVYSTDQNCKFVCLLGHVHPTAYSQSSGNPKMRARHNLMTTIIRSLQNIQFSDDLALYKQQISTFIEQSDSAYLQNSAKLLVHLNLDNFDNEYSHLHSLPLHDPNILTIFDELSVIVPNLSSRLKLLRCDGFCAHLTDEGFLQFIRDLVDPDGNYRMTTDELCRFMCNGVAAACGKDGFLQFIRDLIDPDGNYRMTTNELCKFMCDSVAAACGKDGFLQFISDLVDPDGKYRMTTNELCKFMCGGVAAACGKDGFLKFLRDLIDPDGNYRMTTDELCRFMCDGVAAACGKDGFLKFIRDLIDPDGNYKMTTDELCRFMCGGVASTCGKDGFLKFLRDLIDPDGNYRMTKKQLCRFMCNSVAAACGKDGFLKFLRDLLDPDGNYRMTTDELCKFMCGGVAAACGKDGFLKFLRDLIDPDGNYRMTTNELCKFMCDSVAAACGKDGFLKFLIDLIDQTGKYKMTKKQLCNFMCGGVASACGKDVFLQFISDLVDPDGKYKMTTNDLCKFMCNSVAAGLVKHGRVFEKCVEKLCSINKEVAVTLFGKGGFASRAIDIVDDTIAILQHMKNLLPNGRYTDFAKIFGISPLFTVIAQIRADICSSETGQELKTKMAKYRGNYNHQKKLTSQLKI